MSARALGARALSVRAPGVRAPGVRAIPAQRRVLGAVPVLGVLGFLAALAAAGLAPLWLWLVVGVVAVAASRRPDSAFTTVLVLLMVVVWVQFSPVPTGLYAWLIALVAAWCLLLVHAALSALSSWPPDAVVPTRALAVWARNLAVVAAAVVPAAALMFVGQHWDAGGGQTMSAFGACLALALVTALAWLLRRRHLTRST